MSTSSRPASRSLAFALALGAVAVTQLGCASTHSRVPAATATHAASIVPLPARPEIPASPDLVVERTIDIDAPPEHVFAILTDVERWTDWDPAVKTVKAHAGRSLQVGDRFYQDPAGYECEALVLDVVPGRAVRWRGTAPDGGGIVGVHSYRLVPLEGGGPRVINREEFSKWYLRLVGWASDFGVGDQFERTLAALKQHAEARPAADLHSSSDARPRVTLRER